MNEGESNYFEIRTANYEDNSEIRWETSGDTTYIDVTSGYARINYSSQAAGWTIWSKSDLNTTGEKVITISIPGFSKTFYIQYTGVAPGGYCKTYQAGFNSSWISRNSIIEFSVYPFPVSTLPSYPYINVFFEPLSTNFTINDLEYYDENSTDSTFKPLTNPFQLKTSSNDRYSAIIRMSSSATIEPGEVRSFNWKVKDVETNLLFTSGTSTVHG